MTQDEFTVYLPRLYDEYAQDRAAAAGTPLEVEREFARKQIDGLLPDGIATANHLLWRVVAEHGEAVGTLWVNMRPDEHMAFIYDIVIDAAFRGRGYGKETLLALEPEMRSRDMRRIALSVFGPNHVARHLYEQQGYEIVAMHMQKTI